MLIGLSGYAQAGKDTTADQIILIDSTYKRVAFADKLKDLARLLDPDIDLLVRAEGWEEAKKNPEVRIFLQRLGTSARTIFGEMAWIHAAFPSHTDWDWKTVVTDVRYPNEAQYIQARGGKLIRITRPGVGPANSHISETALDNWGFDAILENNGSREDLRRKLEELLPQWT